MRRNHLDSHFCFCLKIVWLLSFDAGNIVKKLRPGVHLNAAGSFKVPKG
jgi:hypothetical protein